MQACLEKAKLLDCIMHASGTRDQSLLMSSKWRKHLSAHSSSEFRIQALSYPRHPTQDPLFSDIIVDHATTYNIDACT